MTRLPAGSLLSMRETWRAAGALASKPQASFIRAQLITGAISAISMILVPTSFLAALFLRSRMLGAIAIVVLAITTANLAVRQGIVICYAIQQGYWTGWKRTSARRLEHPARFYAWTATHAIVAMIPVLGSIFLAFIAAQMFTSHPH